jgi:ribosomal protein S18 acetylase RimI-like enzyme
VFSVRLRPVEAGESELIFSFLTIAARMAESNEPIQKALVDKELTKYWRDWGREGDRGVVALREPDGLPVACAWVRLFSTEDPCFVAEGVREVAVGTLAQVRGLGYGTHVLERIIESCRSDCAGISLSVRADNPAVRLYRRLGFDTIAEMQNRVGTQSLGMLLSFG